MKNQCPLCKNKDGNFIVEKTRVVYRNENVYLFQCNQCGLIFSSEMNLPFDYTDEKTHSRYELKLVTKLINSKRTLRVLEVGCGDGRNLFKLNKILGKNIELFGSDLFAKFDSPFVQFIKYHELESDKFLEYFDIIFAFHVLEHVPEPCKFLEKLFRMAKKLGVILISVPNPRRTSLKIFRKEVWDYPPYHLTRWSKKTFSFVKNFYSLSDLKLIETPLSFYDLYLYRVNSELLLGRFFNILRNKKYDNFLNLSNHKKIIEDDKVIHISLKRKFKNFLRLLSITMPSNLLGITFYGGTYLYSFFRQDYNRGTSLVAIFRK